MIACCLLAVCLLVCFFVEMVVGAGVDKSSGDGGAEAAVSAALALLAETPNISSAFKTLLSMLLAQQQSGAALLLSAPSSSSSSSSATTEQPSATTATAPPASSSQKRQMLLANAKLVEIQLLIRETLRGMSAFDLSRLQRPQGPDEEGRAYIEFLTRFRALQHACKLLEDKQERRTRWLGRTYFRLVWPLLRSDLQAHDAIKGTVPDDVLQAYLTAIDASLCRDGDGDGDGTSQQQSGALELSSIWSASVDAHIQSRAQQRQELAAALAASDSTQEQPSTGTDT